MKLITRLRVLFARCEVDLRKKLNIFFIIFFVISSISASAEVYLGVYLTECDFNNEIDKELPGYGLKVHHVIKDSPADDAELHEGDLILEVENHKLTKIDQLVDLLKNYKTGDSIAIKYFRDSKILNTKLKLADNIEPDLSNIQDTIEDLVDSGKTFIFRIESQNDNVIGIEISPTHADREGVIITNVLPNSPAQKANLQVGDVIILINGEKVNTTTAAIAAIQEVEAGSSLTLEYLRSEKQMKTQVEVVKRESIFK